MNKEVDKEGCKQWAIEEKQHKLEREKREKAEEELQYVNCVEAKMTALKVVGCGRDMLRDLPPKEALGILDRVDRHGNVNEFIISEAKASLERIEATKGKSPQKRSAADGEDIGSPEAKVQKTTE
eukprot:gnl/TRDRNA2_/TRDRNA2_161653_c10_seq2.p2 gnl/TRDRNA2_/TRDRNA2_161653_c10~~gnl/TRDRNA2_/TRDRNA2_161653_c10_seq2.p2  ORF type:complete len:125 (-),score=46.53 gnl/TRDRNA2_/TRDRNA2_161653_c10_seq2:138-512(-)